MSSIKKLIMDKYDLDIIKSAVAGANDMRFEYDDVLEKLKSLELKSDTYLYEIKHKYEKMHFSFYKGHINNISIFPIDIEPSFVTTREWTIDYMEEVDAAN